MDIKKLQFYLLGEGSPNLAQLEEHLTVVVFLPLVSKGRWFDSGSSDSCKKIPSRVFFYFLHFCTDSNC